MRTTISNLKIAQQTGTSNTYYATWNMTSLTYYVDSYKYEWRYYVNGTWFEGSSGSSEAGTRSCTYSPPDNALKIEVRVKPVSKTYENSDGDEINYFDSAWSSYIIYSLSNDSTSSSSKISNLKITKQSSTARSLYATWNMSDPKNRVDSYEYEWRYYANGAWFDGSTGSSTSKSCTYSPSEDAKKVKVRVKPVSKTYTNSYDTEVSYFTGAWSSWVIYSFSDDNLPETPSVPEISVSKYKLTTSVESYATNTKKIEFQVVSDDKKIFATGKATITKNKASHTFTISAGKEYKVRCRGVNGKNVSSWSEYSSSVGAPPAKISGTPTCKATSSTSVRLTWKASSKATSYSIEYTTKKKYFTSAPDQVNSITITTGTQADIIGMETGSEWFFRIQAVNDNGESSWSTIVSCVLGSTPNAPTTWSMTYTGKIGESIYLYWTHNSEDGSREESAKLRLTINDTTKTITIKNTIDEEDDDGTYSYILDTSSYSSDTTIKWQVRTKGVADDYSPWSAARSLSIYAPPTLTLAIGGASNWYWDTFNFEDGYIYTSDGDLQYITDERLLSYPISVDMETGSNTQKPLSYNISIVANDTYTTTDDIGDTQYITEGQEIFNRNYNSEEYRYITFLLPSDVTLHNGSSYTMNATVVVSSGLTAEASLHFIVDFEDDDFYVNAEIGIDSDILAANIVPYSDDENGDATAGIELSVYRREADGTFTEIATNVSNLARTTVIDQHPTLNYARYRIIGRSRYTGKNVYYDVPGYPIMEKSIVIQWDEEYISYSQLNMDDDYENETSGYNGTILKLPYDIDVSEDTDIDVELIEYIGRKYPVSYYGTQVGQTATLTTNIVTTDEETLYLLRRLAIWMGDVYVREPSGIGYWAQIKVSISQTHCSLVIPVTLNITRVEGGI